MAGDDKIGNPLRTGIERQVVELAVQWAGGRPVPKDRLIGDLAGRQYGVVSRSQLLAMGIGAGAIQTRVRRHYLHRLHRGVYAVGHLALVPLALEMAAVLACGPTATITHRSSAVVWYMLPAIDGADIDVTVLTGKGRRAGLRIHRTTRMSARDIRHFRGLPVTTPSRTVIDLAECVTDRELERALHEAITRRLLDARRLRAELDRYRGRRGISRLKKLLDNHGPSTLTRSAAEERFLGLLRSAGLPAPEVNVLVQGHLVDFLWRDQGLVVEVDGFQFHSSREAFERDRRRDAELQRAGLRALRVTWRQIVDAPYATLANVVGALAA